MNKYRKFQFFLTTRQFWIIAMFYCAVCAQGQIPVVFRYDDYTAGLCEDVFFVEKRLFEIHDKYHIPLAVGVIPMGWSVPLADDPERLILLKEFINKGIAEIGIHGFSHENHSVDAVNSEFRDVPYNIQLEKLSLSKKYLNKWLNHDVTIFMPPWNTYDENTLKILELLDFSILSASFYGGPKAEPPLVSVPYWATIPKEAMQFIKLIERQTDYPPVIFLLHAYDFYESKSDRAFLSLSDYEDLIGFIAQSNNLEAQTLTKLSGN